MSARKTVRHPKFPFIAVVCALCVGLFVGTIAFSSADSWVNDTNSITPNISWNPNVSITGVLTVGGNLVCLSNGDNCPSFNGSGTPGVNGTNGLNGSSVYLANITNLNNGSYRWDFSNGTTIVFNYTTGNLTGQKGATGSTGDTGPEGPQGPQGEPGVNGTNASVTSGDAYVLVSNGVVSANVSAFDDRYYLVSNPKSYVNLTEVTAGIQNSTICHSDGTNCPGDVANGTVTGGVTGSTFLITTPSTASTINYTVNFTRFNESFNYSVPIGVNNASITNLIGRVDSLNITCTASNSTHWNVSNGTGCVMVLKNPPVITTTVANTNSSFTPLFNTALFAAPGGQTIASMNATARCMYAPIQQGMNAVGSNLSVLIDNSNASVGIFIGVYNCTSNEKLECTSGSLIINTSIIRLSATGFIGAGNTTGDWVLPPGNYVTCVSANTTNGQNSVLRGATGSAGFGKVASTMSVTRGNMPATGSFTPSESQAPIYVFLSRPGGVQT